MDLGLPSGTLWLDRLVGAQSPDSNGLFYQWGDIIGHTIAERYNFNLETYQAKGLNLIHSQLDYEHDAASSYYGPIAKMPTGTQFQELISNCVLSSMEGNLYKITSRINGNSIIIRANGFLVDFEHYSVLDLRVWTSNFNTDRLAWSFHIENPSMSVSANSRYYGYNIMAVHS